MGGNVKLKRNINKNYTSLKRLKDSKSVKIYILKLKISGYSLSGNLGGSK